MPRLVLPLVFLLLSAFPALGSDIRVFAAASLSDVAREIAAAFTREHPDVNFIFNVGGSGTLARQIDSGAPADIYLAANSQWLHYLLENKRVLPASVADLGRNALVLIGARDLQISSLEEIVRLRRIAIGSPRSVPAGQYAAEALQAAGIYQRLTAERRLVLTKDVRQALVYAERGEVDAAIVYRTDARLAQKTVVLLEIPLDLHAPVTCPMGLTIEGGENPAARSFFDFLQSPAATRILETHGFVVQ